jgi:hypothetical protein
VSRILRYAVLVLSGAVLAMSALVACEAVGTPTAVAGNGGGAGGSGSGSIWAATWWDGSPQGPGPYIGGPAGGAEVCAWTDVGGALADLVGALATADLPASFWPSTNDGWETGVYALERWAAPLIGGGSPADHFDVVACPTETMVPGPAGYAFTAIPAATPPGGPPRYVWIFWDTVVNPPPDALPPIVGRAFDEMRLPRPVIHTSPAGVGGIAAATVVNFPTWLWIDATAWRTVVATAGGGGLVATVWATPADVGWHASWDFTSPTSDPEGGVNLAPTELALTCAGAGTPYLATDAARSSSPDCGTTFTQSTFGEWTILTAAIEWKVTWALADDAGVVGGEGALASVATHGSVPLRVIQIESVVTAG